MVAKGIALWAVTTTTQGPRSPLFWRTMGSSIARFYRRHGRPVWLQLTGGYAHFFPLQLYCRF
jgi:hypothetical protein